MRGAFGLGGFDWGVIARNGRWRKGFARAIPDPRPSCSLVMSVRMDEVSGNEASGKRRPLRFGLGRAPRVGGLPPTGSERSARRRPRQRRGLFRWQHGAIPRAGPPTAPTRLSRPSPFARHSGGAHRRGASGWCRRSARLPTGRAASAAAHRWGPVAPGHGDGRRD